MNRMTSFLLISFFTCLSLAAVAQVPGEIPAVASDQYMDSLSLRPKPGDVGAAMPLYEVAMISKLCSPMPHQSQVRQSRAACFKALNKAKRRCTRKYQARMPRADNLKRNGRLDHRSFATQYHDCLLNKGRAKKSKVPQPP